MNRRTLIALLLVAFVGCRDNPKKKTTQSEKSSQNESVPNVSKDEKPNIDIRIVKISGPDSIQQGQSPTFEVTIENLSDEAIPGVGIKLRATVKRLTSTMDADVGSGGIKNLAGKEQKTIKIKALNAESESMPGTTAWNFPGSVVVTAKLNHFGEYHDTNPDNDFASTSFWVNGK